MNDETKGRPVTAIERAIRAYEAAFPDREFSDLFDGYARCGYVHIEPGLFGMARPVRASAPDAQIRDLGCLFRKPDAWYVAMASVGVSAAPEDQRFLRLGMLFDLLPFRLPLITFWRTFKPARQARSRRRTYEVSRLEDRAWGLATGIGMNHRRKGKGSDYGD